jgi:glucose/arabinose dehydrogenase
MFLLTQGRRQQISWLTLGISLSLLLGVLGSMWMLDIATDQQTTVAIAAPGAISLKFVPFGSDTFTEPVKIASAGDDRLFVIEQAGKIFVLQADGTKVTTPFLNIISRVGSSGSEQGLLGMVFEPGNPKTFYVNYTNKQGDTTIARYKVTGANQNVADPASEQIVLSVAQPYPNHNAGDLAFGPDGHLYIPLGDGGSGDDPENRAQNMSELLGKILRIHVTGVPTYTIPSDNPFANDGDPNTRAEIWALGLRNPWRFSFDRQTNDMWIGDVGQGAREEIDFQPANSSGGENYGWDCYEGNILHTARSPKCTSNPADYVSPIFDYTHADGFAVTGGYMYRGARYPNLVGHYIFADYGSGNFWLSTSNGQGGWSTTKFAHQTGWPGNPSTFGQDVNGELYVADLSSGIIYQIQDQSAVNTTPTATGTATSTGTVTPTSTATLVPTLVPTIPPFTPRAWVNLPLIQRH